MKSKSKPSKQEIAIHYQKNPFYRTIYADGLIGGKTLANAYSFSFYATRNPIPKILVHDVDQDGTIEPIGKSSEDSKIGIIREIEIGIYMNETTARDIYVYLKKQFESDGK